MEGIDRLVQPLSQPGTTASLDVRGSIETALDEGKDQAQRLMEFCNLGLIMYPSTIKPGDVSDFIQEYIYAKTRTNIKTIIMERELFSLNLAGTRITTQDVVGYISKQFEKIDKEDRSKVPSTRWLFETYFLKFGNYTSDVATHKMVYSLSSETKKEIEEIIKRREVLLTVAGAGVVGGIAYLLTPEEDRPIVVPAAALLGGVATNAMVKR